MLDLNKNNLFKDPSPYLQQHKNNPVNWQIWSEEILDFAKLKSKAILLSIGYASCHWCHVMAHESFEDNETAELMNKYFINVKVDREERPDLDFVFQSSFQLFNQAGGGWPLTMFLDEYGVPFMAGTYFPKNSQHSLPSFKTVIEKVYQTYKDQRENIIKQKHLIIKNLELKKSHVLQQDLEPLLELSLNNLDSSKGGFKGAPKFPMFNLFETFLYFYNKTQNKKYKDPVSLVLKKLCSKGIYDHVEGGISRYTVDEDWIIPHFEKMLYDNTQFILLLSKYCKIEPNKYFTHKLNQTIQFLIEDFTSIKSGLLGSAYDADSDGIEGKYYVYSYEEIKNINNISEYFEINEKGNWENKIILVEKKLAPKEIITELLKIRSKRKKPFFDDKIQLDLNCLWISSLVAANDILPEKKYLQKAEKYFSKIETLFLESGVHHSYSKNIVFLEDYALLINASLDLSEATMNFKYSNIAKKLCYEAISKFYIKEKNIFRKNPINSNDLFFNPIEINDNTIPNGNAIMLINFTRLGLIEEGKKLNISLNGYLNMYKSYMSSAMKAIDFFNSKLSGKNCNDKGCLLND